jgi:hypothetical protein
MYEIKHNTYRNYENETEDETIVTFDLVLGKSYKFNMLKGNFSVLTDLKLEFDISSIDEKIFKKNYVYAIIKEISVLINGQIIDTIYGYDIYHQTINCIYPNKTIINFPLFYNNQYFHQQDERYDCDLIVKICDQKDLLVENQDKKVIIENVKISLTHNKSYEKIQFHKFMTHDSELLPYIHNKFNYINLHRFFVEREKIPIIKEIIFSISEKNNSSICFDSIPIVEKVKLQFNGYEYLCEYGDVIKNNINRYTIKLSDNIDFAKIKDVRLYCTFKKEIADKYCDSDLIIYITTLVY